ncbi:MAG: hypothetical protein ACPGVO_01690 [Spirulinaceae cyanobacterium]
MYGAEATERGDNGQVEEYRNEVTIEELLLRTFVIEQDTPIALQ